MASYQECSNCPSNYIAYVRSSQKKLTLFTPHSTVHLPYNATLCVSCTEIVVLTFTLMCCLQLHSLFVGHSCITSHDQVIASTPQSRLICAMYIHVHTYMCNVYTCTYVHVQRIYMYMYAIIHVHVIHSTQPVRMGLHTFRSCTNSMTYMYTMYIYPITIHVHVYMF